MFLIKMRMSPAEKIGIVLKKIYIIDFHFHVRPIAVLILQSFNKSKTRAHWGGFTFKWLRLLFTDESILKAFTTTILLACLSSLVAVVPAQPRASLCIACPQGRGLSAWASRISPC